MRHIRSQDNAGDMVRPSGRVAAVIALGRVEVAENVHPLHCRRHYACVCVCACACACACAFACVCACACVCVWGGGVAERQRTKE